MAKKKKPLSPIEKIAEEERVRRRKGAYKEYAMRTSEAAEELGGIPVRRVITREKGKPETVMYLTHPTTVFKASEKKRRREKAWKIV